VGSKIYKGGFLHDAGAEAALKVQHESVPFSKVKRGLLTLAKSSRENRGDGGGSAELSRHVTVVVPVGKGPGKS